MSKYSHIELPRDFRNAVKATLRSLPGWEEHRAKYGMPSNGPWTNAEIYMACEALSFDLQAARGAYDARQGARASSVVSAPAIIAASTEAVGAEDIPDETPGAETPAPKEKPMTASPAGYEGRNADAVIAEIIADASAHLTPYTRDTVLPGLLRPVVAAAVAGPRTITKRVASGPLPAVPAANVAQWVRPGPHFSISPSRAGSARRVLLDGPTIACCDYQQAPAIDADYVWQPSILEAYVCCDVSGQNLWSFGPAGTGKTEGASHYAAMLHRPFVRIAIDRSTEAADIIGQWVLDKAGGMSWQDGKLTAAFRMPYCVILVDEPTLLRPGALAVLQTALDTRRIYLPGGEIVEAETGIFIVAADNTAGTGDDSGRYVDTAPMNAAFLDRFGLRVEYTHLSPASEANMLHNRTRIPVPAARLMTDFAALTRRDCSAGKLTMGLTPRRLISWARAVMVGMPSATAFAQAIVQGTAPEDKPALMMLATTSLDSQHATIEALARGETPPVAPAPAAPAVPSATGSAFPNDQAQ